MIRRSLTSLLVLALLLMASACVPPYTTDVELGPPTASVRHPHTIVHENAKAGTTEWEIINPAKNNEIEGYASATSVNRGESISLFVNTSAEKYTIEIFRVGWYGGAGGRRVLGPITRTGVQQPPPDISSDTHLVECNWTSPYVINIPNSPDPTEWASGIYLALLTAVGSGKQSYIVFVVRDDDRRSALLFQSSVTTYQAYNDWGGYSLYSRPKAYKVSFNRPYRNGFGSGDFAGMDNHWELNMVRFLEREGYDVTYSTDIDTHEHGHQLMNHKAFLSVGHDEYWTWEMRNHVESARRRGIHEGFFGANTSYWQVRLEPSPATKAKNRVIVCYKKAELDPMADDPLKQHLTTIKFRNRLVGRPEESMVGVQYEYNSIEADVVVEDAGHWFWSGSGVCDGDRLKGLLGYEVDKIYRHGDSNLHRVAHSPYSAYNGKTLYGDIAIYEDRSGAKVVGIGSILWNYGLDGYRSDRVNAAAQQATRNVLKQFGADPAAP